jgi:hypothetical protein
MTGKDANYKGIAWDFLGLATHHALVYKERQLYDLTPNSGVVYREKEPRRFLYHHHHGTVHI